MGAHDGRKSQSKPRAPAETLDSTPVDCHPLGFTPVSSSQVRGDSRVNQPKSPTFYYRPLEGSACSSALPPKFRLGALRGGTEGGNCRRQAVLNAPWRRPNVMASP
jgi:hypothetical protein